MAGATPLGNMVIKLGLDDADFGKGVANSKKQVQYLAKEMQANMKVADLAGNKLGKLGTRYDSLTQIIKAQENQVTALKKAYDGSFVDGKATDSTKRLANQLQDANGKLANYKLQLQNTAGQMARLQVETQGVTGWLKQHGDAYIKQSEKIQKFGGMVSKAGTALTVGVTAPIVAGATAVTKAAIDWESAFAGVKKTSDEVVDSNGNVVYSYDDLEASLRGLAKELPSTHSEIAAVAEAAGQLGIQTQDITAFTKTMIDMGESTNLSAEEAATAIAKIANITGMTSSEYQRFGSSVVALGNNFATTEADIVQMANRLASAGTLAGLSNQEILGLATAMSSVGIEAEAGGTAMTQTLTAIEKAAVEGGDSLDQFAKVAGMSSSEFAKKWNEKPIEAIQSFIKGLGELDGKGESATLMLDEMGLSGVRQSNMLKSLALASDTLSGAVDMSTQAWEVNTALTNEAGTRYETTESKLKMLRNEAVDAAIEFGGPLVDALRDGLEASKPLIKSFGDMAKAFSSLDKEQQQNIIKWGLMAAAAGPAFKLLGGGISTIGSVTKGVGKLSTGIVKLVASAAEKKAIAGFATSITGVGTAATTAVGTGTAAAGGLAGMGTAIAGLAGPIAIGVVALGAIAGAVYLGKKAYDEHQLAGAKWGTAVTEEQDKVISKSYELRDKAVSYVNEYADGVRGSADKAIEANKEIVDSIQAAMDKEIERKKAAAENLEDPETKAKAEKAIAYEEQVNEALIQQAQKRVDRIDQILTNASKNNRNLSNEERQYIEANYKQLSDKQLEQAGFSKDQRLAIETAYQDDLSKLSTKQLQDRAKNVKSAMNDEQASYEKQKKSIAEIWGENTQAYKVEMDKLEKTHDQTMESMILGYAKLGLEQGFSLQDMAGVWEMYGWTVDEVSQLVNASVNSTNENLDMLAKGTNEADMQWNSLALDPKTGEVRTNMADVLKDMSSTYEGWEQLRFIAKNADISTNAKEEIAIAMGESGKWNELYLTEQQLLVDGDEAKLQLYDTIEKLGMWNQYNADRKLLGVTNADAVYKLMESNGQLEEWNGLSPQLKTLIADDPAKLTVDQTKAALEEYNKLPPALKKLLGNNTNAVNNFDQARGKLNLYNETRVGAKHLHATADYSQVTQAKNEIAQVYSKNVVIDVEYRGRRTGQTAIPNAKGTNYHPGGDMIVNDQSGPLYKELVQFPGEAPFIPQGRNVYIPNAPAGTKVARASITKSIMRRLGIPKYADGVGIPEDSSLVRNLRSLSPSSESSSINVRTQDYSQQLEILIEIMSNFGEDLKNMKLFMDTKVVGGLIDKNKKAQERSEIRRAGGTI